MYKKETEIYSRNIYNDNLYVNVVLNAMYVRV